MKIVIDGWEHFDPKDFVEAVLTIHYEMSDDEIITTKQGERYEAHIEFTEGALILAGGALVPVTFEED